MISSAALICTSTVSGHEEGAADADIPSREEADTVSTDNTAVAGSGETAVGEGGTADDLLPSPTPAVAEPLPLWIGMGTMINSKPFQDIQHLKKIQASPPQLRDTPSTTMKKLGLARLVCANPKSFKGRSRS